MFKTWIYQSLGTILLIGMGLYSYNKKDSSDQIGFINEKNEYTIPNSDSSDQIGFINNLTTKIMRKLEEEKAVIAENKENQGKTNDSSNRTVTNIIESINKAFQETVNYVIELSNYELNDINKLIEKSKNVIESVLTEISIAQEKLTADVDKAIMQATKYNVKECAKFAESFNQTSIDAINEVNNCNNEMINILHAAKKNISNSVDLYQRTLNVIRNNTEQCVKNAKNKQSAVSVKYFVHEAISREVVDKPKTVDTESYIKELLKELLAVKEEVINCLRVNGIEKINLGSKLAIKNVRECIYRKTIAKSQ